MRNKFLLIIAMTMMITAKASAQMIAVNTDVAMDACMAPSLGVELTLGKKSTLNINGLYAANALGKDIRIAAIQPEWRVYISGRPMFRHYVGAIGLLASYKFSHLAGKVYDGDAGGFGLSYGYVWPVTQRLLIDFHTSLGLVFYHQKEYFVGDNYDAHYTNEDGNPYANAHGSLLMPLRIGISVSYILK
ncbi:MAG: DUF3575 domain-containing protein [Prevotella sp.]|nr:DUF3575 domain-containing protein [Prevotella sp.]MBR4651697.1 DUF3575 domain-containing protein [Prevotella sp.]